MRRAILRAVLSLAASKLANLPAATWSCASVRARQAAAWLAAQSRAYHRELLGWLAFGLLFYGCWLAWPPLGFIVAGGILLAALVATADALKKPEDKRD